MGRVVLIDDEARLVKTLCRFLESEGHEVRTAHRFSELGDSLRPGGFDVLVTDIVMPEHTGIEVVRMLTSRGCREPMILMTGEPNVETASEAVRLGAYDYLTKPITKPQLLSVVTRALRYVELVRDRDRARRIERSILSHLESLAESAAMLAAGVRGGDSELRTALAAASERLDGEQRVALDDLGGRMDRLESLLRRTLAFAKPAIVDVEPIDVGTLLERVVTSFCEATGRTVEWRRPDAPLSAQADRRLIEEVVRHLLANAAEATGSGGCIVVGATRRPGGEVVMEFEDDGPGVPESRRSALFVPFETTKAGAVGLGLPRCKKIVEAHGGRIEVGESAHGGLRVRVLLPAGGSVAGERE